MQLVFCLALDDEPVASLLLTGVVFLTFWTVFSV